MRINAITHVKCLEVPKPMPKMHLGHGEHSADVSFYYQHDMKRCL